MEEINKNQKDGIIFIVAGLFIFFIGQYLYIPYIRNIAPLIAIVSFILGIIKLLNNVRNTKINSHEFEIDTKNNILTNKNISMITNKQNTYTTYINKIANVTLTGGLLGMLADSPQNALNRRIRKENAQGWEVINIIPASSGNILLFIFRLILLIITIGLFTTANGYYLILKRNNNLPNNQLSNHNNQYTKNTQSAITTPKKNTEKNINNPKPVPQKPKVVKKEPYELLNDENRKKFETLKSKIKPDEIIIQIRKTKEIKTITKKRYENDKELRLNDKYIVLYRE